MMRNVVRDEHFSQVEADVIMWTANPFDFGTQQQLMEGCV